METNLKGLLKKFDQFLPYESKVRNVVILATQEVLGVTLERSKIKVSGPLVFLSCPAALRSEIMMKQAKILNKVHELDKTITLQKIQ
jgi:hypothetical protein